VRRRAAAAASAAGQAAAAGASSLAILSRARLGRCHSVEGPRSSDEAIFQVTAENAEWG
jgi:hypothetical protein